MEYALEADPGRGTASFPSFASYEEALAAADRPCMVRIPLPMPRILVRAANGSWVDVTQERVLDHVA